MAAYILVYVTCTSGKEAQSIGKKLVSERLAACANILGPMHSVYRWKGKTEEAKEAVLILKTRASLFRKLSARIRTLHSYEVPCILRFDIRDGDPGYLKWILESTLSK